MGKTSIASFDYVHRFVAQPQCGLASREDVKHYKGIRPIDAMP